MVLFTKMQTPIQENTYKLKVYVTAFKDYINETNIVSLNIPHTGDTDSLDVCG